MLRRTSAPFEKKLTPSQKQETQKALTKLNHLISEEAQAGVPFERIFNNDVIKYDTFQKGFYTFKARGRDRSQIRILYKFVRHSMDTYHIEVHKVSFKRRNSKDYIREFQRYVDNY